MGLQNPGSEAPRVPQPMRTAVFAVSRCNIPLLGDLQHEELWWVVGNYQFQPVACPVLKIFSAAARIDSASQMPQAVHGQWFGLVGEMKPFGVTYFLKGADKLGQHELKAYLGAYLQLLPKSLCPSK